MAVLIPAVLNYRQMVSDKEFVDWVDTNTPTDWTTKNMDGVTSYVEENANGVRIVDISSTSYPALQSLLTGTPPAMVVGQNYLWKVVIHSFSQPGALTFRLDDNTNTIGTFSVAGTYTGVHTFTTPLDEDNMVPFIWCGDGSGSVQTDAIVAEFSVQSISDPIPPTHAADGNLLTNFGGYISNGADVDIVQTDADEAIFGGGTFFGDGVTWDKKTRAQWEAFVNGTDNLWLKWVKFGTECHVKQWIQYPTSKVFSQAEYDRAVRWAGDPACGGGVVPFDNDLALAGGELIQLAGGEQIQLG